MGRLMWCYQLLCLQLVLLHSLSCANLCSHDESSALLRFKQLFSFSNSSSSDCSGSQPDYPKMKYWKEDTDCCSWEGVSCDRVMGHVISLDLSCSWLQGNIPSNSSLFLLSHLQKLNLAYNDFNLSQIPSDFVRFPSLTHLNLSYSNFSGQVPLEISHLSKLISIDLYRNDLTLETSVMKGLVQNMSHLQELFLDFVDMSTVALGTLTNINLPSLMVLSLADCELQGSFPFIFINLTQLYLLDLSSNSISGPIPSGIGGLRNLEFIFLSYNKFDGTIPSGLFSLPSLKLIYLTDNQLYGPIPSSIFEPVNLYFLELSSNHLSGTVELYMFAKLKNLRYLDLSYNSLSVSTTIKVNSSFPKLSWLGLSSCDINEFPEILTADNLQHLDLSHNKIHGHIPNWLFNISTLSRLYLSDNFLTGIEQFPRSMGLQSLDLRSNLLQGLLPAPPPFLSSFLVSHNNMTGGIPSSFCNLSSILYLDLSNNSLSGTVPQCLANSTTILALDLRMNSFHGNIPQTFANGSQLTTLNLNGNQLVGSLPPSLVNCVNLKVLDLGNNMINGTFPHWLATLLELQVLILRSNRFYGPLGNSRTRLPFPKLRILDLSHNGFTGPLRTRFFKNLEAMMSGKNNSAERRYIGDGNYWDSVIVTMKGVDIEMQRILTIFTTIDLSCNKFQGRIPVVIGKLNSLKILNFSHNCLIGHIPLSLENLTELESLDISLNRLVGDIPIQLTSLTSLSTLNLSYNQLVGRIPQGKQFNTFENSSYFGNLGLCGDPLSKKCGNDEPPESEPTIIHKERDNSSWFDWKIIMMGYGSGLVIGLSIGYIVFSIRKPWWFVSMVERKVIKLSGRHGRRRRN